MATTDIPADSSGSLGGLSLSDDDDIECDDDALQGDTWIEELECALLADCDPATLKKICEGKRIPASLRPDYWRTLLALNDAGKVKLTNEYDLPNQEELRHDCEQLVEDISVNLSPEPLPESDKLRIKSDFESTLTTYVKARPELDYVSGNGWTDILKVLYNLQLNDAQMYQMFFRIVDRYIPKDLSPSASSLKRENSSNTIQDTINETNNNRHLTPASSTSTSRKLQEAVISDKATTTTASKHAVNIDNSKLKKDDQQQQRKDHENSIQAYHLLRLLIQYHDPELCSILDSKKVTPNLYVKDWFCSLFARSCSPKLALHIWDMHFKMADPFLIFFAAIVMVVNASDELKKSNFSQADMLNALKKMPSLLEEDDVEDLYYLVSNHYTNSTPRSIRSYSHLFFMDTFGATYMGNESPELTGSAPLVDLKTCRLTSSLDLSQHLCLPIVPAEIFAIDTAQQRSSPVASSDAQSTESDSPSRATATTIALRYFLVDCRPAEQYNAGHLTKAFHLDCSLMLREPSSFATAVQALLEIQRQVVASKSNTGGQHLCFIGSGQDEEDRYVNMVVASFLQKCQKYVSIVYGGFDAIHDYVKTKSELRDSFDKYIVDHNEALCKTCCANCPEALERLKAASSLNQQRQQSSSSTFSAQSLLASTTGFFRGDKAGANATSALTKFAASNPQATATAQQLAYSGASMFDKFTTAFAAKSNVIKDRLVESINNATLPSPALTAASSLSATRGHVSSQDRLGPRYTGGNYNKYDNASDRRTSTDLLAYKTDEISEEPCQEIQIDQWQKDNEIMAIFKCAQIKGNLKYPGYIGLNKTHLWILREIPHNKGFASIAAKRPLDMVVQITSKRRQSDIIIFRYGYTNSTNRQGGGGGTGGGTGQSTVTTVASDHLHIPQSFEVIRVIKREVVRIMDERGDISRQAEQVAPQPQPQQPSQAQAPPPLASTGAAAAAETAPPQPPQAPPTPTSSPPPPPQTQESAPSAS